MALLLQAKQEHVVTEAPYIVDPDGAVVLEANGGIKAYYITFFLVVAQEDSGAGETW